MEDHTENVTVSGGRISIGGQEEKERCACCQSTEGVKMCWSTHIVEGHGEVTGSVPYCAECRRNPSYNFEAEGADFEGYRRGAFLCPYCKETDPLMVDRESWSLRADSFPEILVPCQCQVCDREWFEVFTLTGLEAK